MITTGSNIFYSTFEQAKFISECAGLRHEITDRPELSEGKFYPQVLPGHYEMWQDVQTGGGGCRIVWKDGIAWISRHSGYSWADITDDVASLFSEIGCKSGKIEMWNDNPHIYG